MTTIELANSDKVAIIDHADFEGLVQFKWFLHAMGYAYRQAKDGSKKVNIYMHRVVNETPDGYDTDHINHNKLDNRRENLRTLNRSDNLRHTAQQGFERNHGRYSARFRFRKKRYYLGTFATIQEARTARENKIKELEAEYAGNL